MFMKGMIRSLFIAGIVYLLQGMSGIANEDSLLIILKKELSREYQELSKEDPPLYFLEYRVSDIRAYSLKASFGSLVEENRNNSRICYISARVGDYTFDNTHISKKAPAYLASNSSYAIQLPVEDNELSIRQRLWQVTDYVYKNAMNSYTKLSNLKSEEKEDGLLDFSQETSEKYMEEKLSKNAISFNKDDWKQKLKEVTKPFLKEDSIFNSNASLAFYVVRKYYVNSEGTELVQNNTYAYLSISADIKADDNYALPYSKTYFAYHPNQLPGKDKLLSDAQSMIKTLNQLKNAELAQPYTGPAILSEKAAGVFFHEIFGHRIEGSRLSSAVDGQTFKERVSDKILPKFLSVYSDPTLKEYNNYPLNGYYAYDDEGIKAQRVVVVKEGILKNFLMARKPIEGFEHSNGHGRAQAGRTPVSRQSNLIIHASETNTEKELRKKLIQECKKQKLDYGYYFKEVVGGFTLTNRYTPNVFNIMPVEVYKVYVDGRPDKLVRGVDLIGTPLAIFSGILAAGENTDIFTGSCGAESGYVPVTAISPALLIKKIETQKKPETYIKLPILPRPDSDENKWLHAPGKEEYDK